LSVYLTREIHTPMDVLFLFLAPLIGEIIVCLWVVIRRPLIKLAYRNVTQASQDEPIELISEFAPDQPPRLEQIEMQPPAPDAQNDQNINPFMLLYLRSLLNEQNGRMEANTIEQRNAMTLLEWLAVAHNGRSRERRPSGVSAELLSVLPTFPYEMKPHQEHHERLEDRIAHAENCTICLSDYEEGETLRTLPCFHIFHKDCIDDWLKQSKVCPVCKYQVDTVQPSYVENV
jgi:hypothetical protein